MVKIVLRSAEKFSEPFPPLSVTPLPLPNKQQNPQKRRGSQKSPPHEKIY